MHSNLSSFIKLLEKEGELIRIKTSVNTQYEITEITDRISKSKDGGKALLFENCGTEFPVIMNMMGSERRMQLALGVDSLESLTERIDAMLRDATSPKKTIWDKLNTLPMLADMAQWLPSTSSSKGECQQVILQGNDIDLDLLPILKCWRYDGGRFVTLPMVNTIDPDTGQRNVGMYRMQVFDKSTTGMHWHIHKTGARHYDGYKRRGERMPISVALGGDPTYTFAATAPMPESMDEYLLAGFLRRKGVKLVKCITNDIYVPSDCDFVIEGYVDPSEEKVIEGPFGDHTGFYSLTDYYPKFHVTAITHRRGAIYPATIVGVPPQEDAYIAMATERIFVSPIRFALQPEVRDMTMPTAGTAHNIALISIAQRYAGQGRKVIQSLWGAGQMMFNKYLLITDHNVNIRNSDELAQLLRNANIRNSIVQSEGVFDVLDHATATNGYGGKLALDLSTTPTAPQPNRTLNYPNDLDLCTSLVDRWSTLIIYAEADEVIDAATIGVEGVNFILLLDKATKTMNDYDILWLAAANSDPRRDASITSDGALMVDARSKRPGKDGNPDRFPNVVTSHKEIVELVDRRWAEYGLGEFIESPSNHYRKLLLSESEQWAQD